MTLLPPVTWWSGDLILEYGAKQKYAILRVTESRLIFFLVKIELACPTRTKITLPSLASRDR